MLDILELRDKLNSLAFKDGARRVLIGRISDTFPSELPDETVEEEEQVAEEREDDIAIVEYLQQLQRELGHHDLLLVRGEDDRDTLFAVQQLRRQSQIDLSWIAEGLRWVSIVMTASLEMVVPGILGLWLDSILGTRFLAILGLLVGVPLGIWHLLQALGSKKRPA